MPFFCCSSSDSDSDIENDDSVAAKDKGDLEIKEVVRQITVPSGMGGSHCDRFNRNYADLSQAFILIPKKKRPCMGSCHE